MRKVIPSVFQYTDYNVLLNADFEQRTKNNSHYSLRSYARDLNLSPGYLSSVLRGKKNFNNDNYKSVFSLLGFSDTDELYYIKSLIDYKVSDNQLVRTEALNYIKQHYDTLGLKDHSEHDEFLKSPSHFIIYMLVEKAQEYDAVKQSAIRYGVPEDQFKTVLEDLISRNYIQKETNRLSVVEGSVAVTDSKKILDCADQLSSHLFANMKAQGGISFPEKSTHSLVLGFNEETFQQAMEVYKQFLHQIYRISKNSKGIDRTTIFSDVMMTAPLKTAENT
ncbi:MAG: TIGR02147 family protein [Bdellovibrionales bacterium]|nr:TIGR02147 family protein [Bdellovibrionales bacterium]